MLVFYRYFSLERKVTKRSSPGDASARIEKNRLGIGTSFQNIGRYFFRSAFFRRYCLIKSLSCKWRNAASPPELSQRTKACLTLSGISELLWYIISNYQIVASKSSNKVAQKLVQNLL